MANTVLIIGGSGSGKSTSIRNLEPKSTFILNVINKPLPFRGYKSQYVPITGWDDKDGNYYASDDWKKILKCIQLIDKERPDIETIVLDDFQYLMAHEYIKRASESGYGKYVELAQHVWMVLNALICARDDLSCFVLSHNETDQFGKSKIKTIGKMLDEKITLEGMFSTVLHSMVIDDEYKFLTRNDGTHTAKSPLGMFDDKYIDNDLAYVKAKVDQYFNYEEQD